MVGFVVRGCDDELCKLGVATTTMIATVTERGDSDGGEMMQTTDQVFEGKKKRC